MGSPGEMRRLRLSVRQVLLLGLVVVALVVAVELPFVAVSVAVETEWRLFAGAAQAPAVLLGAAVGGLVSLVLLALALCVVWGWAESAVGWVRRGGRD